jgi:dihydroxyacid dehydratase/phosphogluconate dehydratase
VLAAIHLSVASYDDEPINKIRNGDVIILNSKTDELDVDVSEVEWNAREGATFDRQNQVGDGRERFAFARKIVRPAHEGGSFILA